MPTQAECNRGNSAAMWGESSHTIKRLIAPLLQGARGGNHDGGLKARQLERHLLLIDHHCVCQQAGLLGCVPAPPPPNINPIMLSGTLLRGRVSTCKHVPGSKEEVQAVSDNVMVRALLAPGTATRDSLLACCCRKYTRDLLSPPPFPPLSQGSLPQIPGRATVKNTRLPVRRVH